jgi:uncharacterized repeat protein (TIGR01451 family)
VVNTVSELSDSTLLFTGQSEAFPNPIVMAVTDTNGRSYFNKIQGVLTNSCNNDFLNWVVTATRTTDGNTFYGQVDSSNRFKIYTDTGAYKIKTYPTSLLWSADSAFIPQVNPNQFISLNINCVANCPLLKVDITTDRLRRCFESDCVVQYCNRGTTRATGAYVEVQLDSLLQYVSATLPLTSRVGQRLRFNVGDVPVNTCRFFQISALVACGDSTRLGQSLCTQVRIYPDTICVRPPNWTGANIQVSGRCDLDSVVFTVANLGNAASSPLNSTTIENSVIVNNSIISIGANSQKQYRFPANGNTWRMNVQQEPNHPYQNQPSAVVEGCRLNTIMPRATGFVTTLPSDTRNPVFKTFCMEIVGSFDPNDKKSFPTGYGVTKLIEPNQDIEYMIRFQNTGTDTAIIVTIKDTLSNLLDPFSIQPLASSHRYEWRVFKNNILQFRFPNILLVDSFRNERLSHGFVKFHIRQKKDIALGSKIYNSAGIYFDFNPPVITNRTLLTVGKQFILSGVSDERSKWRMRIVTYPNPTSDRAFLEILDAPEDALTRNFQLFDATGRHLRQASFKGTRYELERDGLSAGFYFFRVEQGGQMIGTGRIVIQ